MRGPRPRTQAEIEARFWSHVQRGSPDECWPWKLAPGPYGHGRFRLKRGASISAHRFAYILANGPIATSDIFVCHRCDNPPCCNPAHLWLGTIDDNFDDMRAKRRQARGEAHGKTTLTETQVREIRGLIASRLPMKRIAASFGVDPGTVANIRNGKTWTGVA